MNKGNLVKEVAKVVSTKKEAQEVGGVEKEGYGYTDWFRDL